MGEETYVDWYRYHIFIYGYSPWYSPYNCQLLFFFIYIQWLLHCLEGICNWCNFCHIWSFIFFPTHWGVHGREVLTVFSQYLWPGRNIYFSFLFQPLCILCCVIWLLYWWPPIYLGVRCDGNTSLITWIITLLS